MKKAAAVCNRGGTLSSPLWRELGIPAIVGCIDATKQIKDKQFVTVSAEGDVGYVYEGKFHLKCIQHHQRFS